LLINKNRRKKKNGKNANVGLFRPPDVRKAVAFATFSVVESRMCQIDVRSFCEQFSALDRILGTHEWAYRLKSYCS
jgi:hypothetical protein